MSEGKSTSAWNAAGTWEERDVTKWANQNLKDRLMSFKYESEEKHSIKITSVTKVEGEATITFPRGKKRAGYEYEIHTQAEVLVDNEPVKGKIEFPYICDDVANHQYEIKFHFNNKAPKQLLDSARLALITEIKNFYDELLKQ